MTEKKFNSAESEKAKKKALEERHKELLRLRVSGTLSEKPRTEEREEIPGEEEEIDRKLSTIEEEIRQECEAIPPKENSLRIQIEKLKNRLSDLTSFKEALFLACEHPRIKEDLEREIAKKEKELAGLERSWFGRIKDKQRESDINAALEKIKQEISLLPQKVREAKQKIPGLAQRLVISERLTYPEANQLLKEGQAALGDIEKELLILRETKERLMRPASLFAYGGTKFALRSYIGHWPEIPEETFQDYYGLSGGEVSFGVGEKGGKRFIILRQQQNISNRGGYPYTALFDPGELIWRLAENNAALIIRNILENPDLTQKLLYEPDRMSPMQMSDIINELKKMNWSANCLRNESVEQVWLNAEQNPSPVVIGPKTFTKPTPGNLACALAALPGEMRKKITFIIGAGSGHGRVFGSRVIWDPGK